MKKTILSVMKKVMLLALLLTMGNIYSYSSPVQVSLGQGDITLKAGYIEIKNSTTVPLGTILTIEN